DGAPTGLSPDRTAVTTSAVTLSCDPTSGADLYEHQIEYASSGTWRAYYTYAGSSTDRTFYPSVAGTTYRFRVRARVGGAFGPWSAWASFDYR
ncbi:MAG TPA: fibronectin type III domain-containing protein, partial [Sandaracinaceae bacterium LLY-WYZ-13_1]|nr:fibronectin type III domain-containing protein [Sandaracinaceae bacterium LLY-WYZ-13_1]